MIFVALFWAHQEFRTILDAVHFVNTLSSTKRKTAYIVPLTDKDIATRFNLLHGSDFDNYSVLWQEAQ